MIYAGIGSRKTPPEILALMRRIAASLQQRGWLLRSGGADGADSAFEQGAGLSKEVFLPWKAFNNNPSLLFTPSSEAMSLAGDLHPGWRHLSPPARKLMARNCHQILGQALTTPAMVVIAWTPDGCESHATRSRVTGGTGQAISLASLRGIPVVNLKNEDAMPRLRDLVLNISK